MKWYSLLVLSTIYFYSPVYAQDSESSALMGTNQLQPAKEKLRLKANDVDFDGSKVRMSGDVFIRHTFGKLYCDKGVLLLSESEQKLHTFMPSRIMLKGDVHVELHDGSVIDSEEADINCITLEGVFTATLPRKVVYISSAHQGLFRAPLRAESRALRLKMKRQEGKKAQYIFTDLQAEDAVHIEYDKEEKKTNE